MRGGFGGSAGAEFLRSDAASADIVHLDLSPVDGAVADTTADSGSVEDSSTDLSPRDILVPTQDAGPIEDAGNSVDAGPVEDTGGVADAVPIVDAGPVEDAAPVVDAAPAADAAAVEDASSAAGWPVLVHHSYKAEAQGLHVDNAGDVYITGLFRNRWQSGVGYSGELHLGDVQHSVIGSQGTFLARYSGDAQQQWGRVYQASTILHPWHIASDGSGTSYLTGIFVGTAQIQGSEYVAYSGGQNPVVWTVDAAGSMTHFHHYSPGGQNAQGQGLALSAGYQSVAGLYGSRVDFGSVQLPQIDRDNGFGLLLNPDRTVRWARAFSCDGVSYGYGTALLPSGVSFFAGMYNSLCDFGFGEVNQLVGNFDIFITSYDSDGTPLWQQLFGSTGWDQPRTMEADELGNTYAIGSLAGVATVGDVSINNAGGNDGFVVAFSRAGSPTWGHNIGGTGSDDAYDVKLGIDRVYVAGSFRESMSFNGDQLASAEGQDGFVAWFTMDGTPIDIAIVGGPGDQEISALYIDQVRQRLWILGSFTQGFTLNGRLVSPLGDESVFLSWLPLL